MFGDHPPGYGDQHPWHDPLAPQEIFNPRPDADLAMAGALAPDPRSFPFTTEGRAAYYDAVRSAAQQQRMMQMQHLQSMQHVQGAQSARADDALKEAAAVTERNLLLLLGP